jgi:hypothetical protein
MDHQWQNDPARRVSKFRTAIFLLLIAVMLWFLASSLRAMQACASQQPATDLRGNWEGTIVSRDARICDYRIEVRDRKDGQAGFIGYAGRACLPLFLAPIASPTRTTTTPILYSGTAENGGAIYFHIIKVINHEGLDACASSSVRLIPLESNELAAEFDDGCHQNDAMLRKTGS